jgi:outer membrane protein
VRLEIPRTFLALAFLVVPALAVKSATGAEHSLTLDEAIALSLRKNEAIRIEREALAAAAAEVSGTNGAYDPVLQLEGAWRRSTEPLNSSFSGASPLQAAPEIESAGAGLAIRQLLPTGAALSLRASGAREKSGGLITRFSPAYGTQVGVELRQPLLRDRAIDAARLSVRVATAGRQGAGASLQRVLTETVAAVEKAYWALVASRLSVGVREEAVRLAEEQLGETRARVETGAVPRTELAQPRAELERRRSDLLATRETVARAENGLKFLILGDADEDLWLARIAPAESVVVDLVPVDVPASLQRALASRPELKAAEAVMKRRRAETSFARDGAWPSLDAVASYDRYGLAGTSSALQLHGGFGQSFETLRDGDFDAARVALVLELPITNRTARATATAALHVERQAEADMARIRKAIRTEVLDAAAALETAGQRIEATRSGREAAEVQLAAEKDRYATGLSTNFLVLTRQNDLSRARLDEIAALTDYRTARAEMGRASASLAHEHGFDTDGKAR